MSNRTSNLRILVSFITTTLILMGIGTLTYVSFVKVQTQKKQIDTTFTKIEKLQNILSDLKDVQSSQRGYIITHLEDYLTPYYLALPNIEENLSYLEGGFVDNPEQVNNLHNLKKEINRRLEIAEEIIQTFNKEGQEKSFALVKSGAGKREMDQIRILVAEMVGEETRLLDARQKNVDDSFKLVLRVGTMGIIVCFLILAIVFFFIVRESRERNKAEDSLRDALDDVRRISDENNLLSRTGDYLQSCQTIEEACRVVEDNILTLFPNTSGNIFLFNNSRNLLERIMAWGNKGSQDKDISSDDCWALRRGQPHVSTSGNKGSCCYHVNKDETLGAYCIPMQAHGEVIGLFFMEVENEGDFLSERQEVLLRQVSEQISLAISNLKLQQMLREQSVRDPLTHLFNRRYLEETMEREMSRAFRNQQPLSLMVLDIDHFKKFNDTKGHDAGDALLTQFAQLLRQKTRREDIVCRYGGEEFVIVMPGSDLKDAEKRAQEICNATRSMKAMHERQSLGDITVSIGLAGFPSHADTSAQLITVADQALYIAKDQGRNQVVVAS